MQHNINLSADANFPWSIQAPPIIKGFKMMDLGQTALCIIALLVKQ